VAEELERGVQTACAPYETTVEGRVVKGKLVDFKVTPEARRSDVTVAGKASD